LRLRVVDAQRLNPASIMPAYPRTRPGARGRGLARQAHPEAQQIEDVVAWLADLAIG
jgi:sulfur-oxidizing protein SoxX